MIDFLNRLFGRHTSSATAKERLRLVLMSDHLSLAPEMVDAMKRDLVEVISRYVEVDRSKIEVNFEQQDRTVALLANIPIVSVGRTGGGDSSGSASSEPPVPPAPPQEAPQPVAAQAVEAPPAPASPAPATPQSGSSKRRKKKSSASQQRPATAN